MDETIKAWTFQEMTKIFLLTYVDDIDFVVSDVQFANSMFKEPASGPEQGCQMVYFQTQNPNLGKFWRALEWNILIYFMPI
jgi:hypothetical protein